MTNFFFVCKPGMFCQLQNFNVNNSMRKIVIVAVVIVIKYENFDSLIVNFLAQNTASDARSVV